jgi:hypothetical protein
MKSNHGDPVIPVVLTLNPRLVFGYVSLSRGAIGSERLGQSLIYGATLAALNRKVSAQTKKRLFSLNS